MQRSSVDLAAAPRPAGVETWRGFDLARAGASTSDDVLTALGFTRLPAAFFAILAGMIAAYLVLAEPGKAFFFRPKPGVEPLAREITPQHRWVLRRGSSLEWP